MQLNLLGTMKLQSILSCALAAFSFSACGTDDGKANGGGGDAGPTCTTVSPTFTALAAEIFDTPTCNQAAACHGTTPQGNLLLTGAKADIYNALVTPGDTDQTESRGTFPKRVVASNSNDSFLWIKLTDSTVPRGRMPLALPALNQCQLDAVKAWIEAGALNN